ncbi:multidrug effflux MFS transporter [Sphingomonas sp. SUN019]|uniref:multidrug effflux MFS transporter n=1 Tax=Sphingomonas sp. SUN019 TaxID=2937788 RepID=UPI0021645258|nr:multidrug effflux MFS transporter [Sphingomonas sp. SUN019]UVO51525.1 multidrug effflux MFS transporter [Sphingomonas sp. SUN019]
MPSAEPNTPDRGAAIDGAPIGTREFVALIASLMAMGALGIDSMLPALPAIADSLGVTVANHRQYVIMVFGAGFGVAQLIHGPLADRYGRRNVLLVSLALYAVANVCAAIAGSFELLLAARFAGGACVAATRVATVAMVRDCYSGRAMARIMSLAFMIFMIVPIAAPAFGAAVLLFGDWRTIFWVVAGLALVVMAWLWVRMPETLHAEDRRPIEAAPILAGWRITLTDRYSLGYTLAAAALTGALYGYLGSIEQIMAETFARPKLLVVVFATTAGMMAVANLLNSRIVMSLGTRRIAHGALVLLITASALHFAIAAAGYESLIGFGILMAVMMACFALSTSNFSAMAMEKMGHIAGTASSVQGFLAMTLGTALGAAIGQGFDGSVLPMVGGFLLAALVALALAAKTERGRLFQPA